jgi:hypothetical protein
LLQEVGSDVYGVASEKVRLGAPRGEHVVRTTTLDRVCNSVVFFVCNPTRLVGLGLEYMLETVLRPLALVLVLFMGHRARRRGNAGPARAGQGRVLGPGELGIGVVVGRCDMAGLPVHGLERGALGVALGQGDYSVLVVVARHDGRATPGRTLVVAVVFVVSTFAIGRDRHGARA